MSSGMPILMFLSPETLMIMGMACVLALWVYFGWIRPIQKIRDPSVKTKTGHVLILLILGISPVIVPIVMGVMSARSNASSSTVNGTSMNAMGPQPVVSQGPVARANQGFA